MPTYPFAVLIESLRKEIVLKHNDEEIPSALAYCHCQKQLLPDWLEEKIYDLLLDHFGVGRPGRRTNDLQRRFAHEMDLLRYHAVKKGRKECKTWDEAFKFASKLLSHTEVFGGEDAMKRSYQKIRREIKKRANQ